MIYIQTNKAIPDFSYISKEILPFNPEVMPLPYWVCATVDDEVDIEEILINYRMDRKGFYSISAEEACSLLESEGITVNWIEEEESLTPSQIRDGLMDLVIGKNRQEINWENTCVRAVGSKRFIITTPDGTEYWITVDDQESLCEDE